MEAPEERWTEVDALAERVAELETRVSELEAAIAELLGAKDPAPEDKTTPEQTTDSA